MKLYPQSFTGGASQTTVALGTTPPVAPVHRLARVSNDHLSFMDVARVDGAEWGKPPYTTNTVQGFAFSLNYTLQGGATGVLPSPGNYYTLSAHGVLGHNIDDLWDGEPWLTDDLPYPSTPWTTLQVHTVLPGSEVNPYDHAPPADLTKPAAYGSRGEYVLLKAEATLATTLTDCTSINLHGRPAFLGDDRVFDWNHTFATPTTLPAGTVIRFFYPVAYREWAADRALTLPISEWGYWEGVSEASNYVTVAAHNESVTGSMDAFSDWYIGYVPKYDLAVPFMTIDEDWGYPLWFDLRENNGFDLTQGVITAEAVAGVQKVAEMRVFSATAGNLSVGGVDAAAFKLSLDGVDFSATSVAIPANTETVVYLAATLDAAGTTNATLGHPDGSSYSLNVTAASSTYPVTFDLYSADEAFSGTGSLVLSAGGEFVADNPFAGIGSMALTGAGALTAQDGSADTYLLVFDLYSDTEPFGGVGTLAIVGEGALTADNPSAQGPFRLEISYSDGSRIVIGSDEQPRLTLSGD